MPEISADDLDLLDSLPASTPLTMRADEATDFDNVVVETTDAPQSFWARRGGDVQIATAGMARPVGSALVKFGNAMLKDVPSPYGDIRQGRTSALEALSSPDTTVKYIGEQLSRLAPKLDPRAAETVGKLSVQTGMGLQDLVDTFVEKKMKGREGEGSFDLPRDLTQGAVSILGSVGAAVVLRNPTVPAIAIGGGSYFETYDKAIQKGKSYQEAEQLAQMMGISQGGTEFFGLHTFINIAGPAFKRFLLSGLTEAVQEGTQQGFQEGIERGGNISDTTKIGLESVSEGVVNSLYAASLGFALGGPASVMPAMANRRSAKQALIEAGYTEEQANKTVDSALRRGVAGALEIVNQEKQLLEKGIYRDAEGNPTIDSAEGPRILTQEEVVAKFTEVPTSESSPMLDAVKEVINKALPQKEAIGVTQVEKEFFDPQQESTQEIITSEPTLKALEEKFAKIETMFKTPKKITKEQIKATQKALQSFIKSKNLPLADRAKLETTILNTQTKQQLERTLPEVREAIAVLKEKQSQRDEIARFKDLSQEQKISKTAPHYQKDIRDLVKGLDPSKTTVKKAISLEKLAQFLEENPDNSVPAYRIAELRRLELKSLRDMSSQDIKAINDAISHLYKLNELKATIIYKRKVADADAIVTDAVRRLNTVPPKSELNADEIDPTKFAGDRNIFGVLKDYMTIDRKHVDILAQELDTSDDGPIKNIIWGGVSDAKTNTLRLEQAVEDYFSTALKGIDVTKWSEYIASSKKDIEKDTFTFGNGKKEVKIPITKAQQIYFFLAMQNESSARHITEGGISFDKDALRGVSFNVPPETIASIMQKVANDPEMMKVANTISSYLNGFQKDLLNNASLRLLGFSVAMEDNYVHIRVNPNMRTRMAEMVRKNSASYALLEGLGLLKQRVKSSAPIYLDDIFASVQESSYYSIRYATYAEPLRAAKRLVNDQSFRTTLEKQGRGNYLKALEEHIERVEGDVVTGPDIEKGFNHLNRNVQASILRLNPRIALLQYTAYISASTEIDAKYWAPSFSPIASAEVLSEIKQWSPKMYDRTRGHNMREIGELVDTQAVKKMFTGKTAYDDWMLAGIRKSDRAVLTSIWRAIKAEVKDTNPELKGDAFFRRVAERAEEAVRKTQAPFDINDRSAVMGRKDWVSRTFSVFGSEVDALANIIHRAQLNWNQSKKEWSDLANYSRKLAAIYLVNGLVVAFLRLPFNILKEAPDKGREDEEEKDAEEITKRLLVDILTGPAGLIFGVRELATIAVSKTLGVSANWDISQPVIATISDVWKGFGNILSAVREGVLGDEFSEEPKKKKKEWIDKLGDGIVDTAVSAAMLRRIPAANVQRFIDPLFAEPKEEE